LQHTILTDGKNFLQNIRKFPAALLALPDIFQHCKRV
jgi:hypothetical protein